MKGYLIGGILIAIFICGFMMINPEANQRAPQMTINRPLRGGTGPVSAVLVGFVAIALPCIAVATIALLKAAPEAEAAAKAIGVPSAGIGGCAKTLATIAGIVVLFGFCLLASMMTAGGG